MTRDELARRIESNLSRAEANMAHMEAIGAAIDANLTTIESASWRLFRNRKLVAVSRLLAAYSQDLRCASERLMAENAALLALHQSAGGGTAPR